MQACVSTRLLLIPTLAVAAASACPPHGVSIPPQGVVTDRGLGPCKLRVERGGALVELSLDQFDRDLALSFRGPDGVGGVLDVYETGPETAWIPVRQPGDLLIELRPVEKRRQSSPYRLRVVAIRAFEPEDDLRVHFQTLSSRAKRLHAAGDQNSALELYQQALGVAQQARLRGAELATMVHLGTVLHFLGRLAEAERRFAEALHGLRVADTPWTEAECLNNYGATLWQLGEFQVAIDRYFEARSLMRRLGHRRGESAALSNLGIIHREMGDQQKACDYYRMALSIANAIGDPVAEAFIQSNLGVALHALSQNRLAIRAIERARDLFHAAGQTRFEGRVSFRLAETHFDLGAEGEARHHLAVARRLSTEVGDRRTIADTLTLTARIQAAARLHQAAESDLAAALDLYRKLGNRSGEASALHLLGIARSASGAWSDAAVDFGRALDIRREAGIRDGEAETLYQLARLERLRGRITESWGLAALSLDRVDALRGLVGAPRLRMAYLSSRHEYYAFAIDLLAELHDRNPGAGYDLLAFETAERNRARSLLDIAGGTRSRAWDSDPQARLRDRRKAEVNFWSSRLADLASRAAPDGQIDDARRKVESALDAYREVDSLLRARASRLSELPPPALTLQAIRDQVLPPDTALVQYFLAEPRSFQWIVTRSAFLMRRLPANAVIEERVREFYALVSSPPVPQAGNRAGDAAAALERLLLEAGGIALPRRILLAPDGILYRLPFSALPQAGVARPATAREFVVVPSASALWARRQRPRDGPGPTGDIVVLADPIFDPSDRRIPGAKPAGRKPRYPRLAHTFAEAETIYRLFPPDRARIARGADASSSLFFDGSLLPYRLVHVATHAELDESNSDLSALVLSLADRRGRPRNGFLRLHEIAELRLQADLVALSACSTGLGRDQRGEGPLSIAHAFLHAGARAVLVSLWNVEDEASKELMTRFYAGLRDQGPFRPAEALLRAQAAIRAERAWSHPFYWAGWTLMGDWRR